MKTILCFGDSNTWGRVPGVVKRFDWNLRWTGVLQSALGPNYRIVEEGLRGRTTAFSDPLRPGRNGREILPTLLESHSPLDLVVIMLGTNDLKDHLGLSPQQVADGVEALLQLISQSDSPDCRVLLIAPPRIVPTENQEMMNLFQGAIGKSEQLAAELRRVAEKAGVHFLDAGLVISSDPEDGIHFKQHAHGVLGRYLATLLRDLFGESKLPVPLPLTEEAKKRVRKLFAEDSWDKVETMLSEECGNRLPLLQDVSATNLERFHFAALKLSEGRMEALEAAIRLAKEDWRDLLVAAGFGHDPSAHKNWLSENE